MYLCSGKVTGKKQIRGKLQTFRSIYPSIDTYSSISRQQVPFVNIKFTEHWSVYDNIVICLISRIPADIHIPTGYEKVLCKGLRIIDSSIVLDAVSSDLLLEIIETSLRLPFECRFRDVFPD